MQNNLVLNDNNLPQSPESDNNSEMPSLESIIEQYQPKTEKGKKQSKEQKNESQQTTIQPKEKELILEIYNIIEQTLNNEKEREALIDKIEKEITK